MARKWAWVGVSISSMWIAVLFIAVFAPTLEAVSAAGDRTTFPIAGVVAAGVAFIATIVLAANGFKESSSVRDLDLERRNFALETRIAELEKRMPAAEEPKQARARVLLSR
jgi:hypothetical protein